MFLAADPLSHKEFANDEAGLSQVIENRGGIRFEKVDRSRFANTVKLSVFPFGCASSGQVDTLS